MAPTTNFPKILSAPEMEAITIEPVTNRILAFPLLLTADPSRESVLQYLQNGECYAAISEGKMLGAYVLQRTRPFTMELMNVAVKEDHRRLGIGRLLVTDAIDRARSGGSRILEVGTGNSSIAALAMYQKLGFRMKYIDVDYFKRNYQEELIENGIVCQDMVRLSIDL